MYKNREGGRGLIVFAFICKVHSIVANPEDLQNGVMFFWLGVRHEINGSATASLQCMAVLDLFSLNFHIPNIFLDSPWKINVFHVIPIPNGGSGRNDWWGKRTVIKNIYWEFLVSFTAVGSIFTRNNFLAHALQTLGNPF